MTKPTLSNVVQGLVAAAVIGISVMLAPEPWKWIPMLALGALIFVESAWGRA